VLGRKAYPSLLEVPGNIDVVDIFRRPHAVGPIVDAAGARRSRANGGDRIVRLPRLPA
jgi:predicted CoA-binding protein